MKHVQAIGRQRGLAATQPEQVTREAVVIDHVVIGALDARPPHQQLGAPLPVGPVLVLEKFLTHEQHRHAGRREQ